MVTRLRPPLPPLRQMLLTLAGPKVATVALAWLMVLLVLGTWAQASVGLYQAQLTYFSSFILWLGPLPTPGGATTLAALTLGLSLKLLLRPWRWQQAGSLLAHLSVWLLLLGGAMTALTSQEGYLRVAEGQTSAVMNSYHTPELAVLNAHGQTLLKYDVAALQPGARLGVGAEQVFVEAYFPNSQLRERPVPMDDGLTKGARKFLEFSAKAAEPDDERNRPTLLFTKLNAAGEPTARLVLFQGQPVPQPVAFPGQPSATLVLRPAQTPLPFAVQLQQFEQEYYPGTAIARHYASAVKIQSPRSGAWPATIRMNEPLRYQGYTLYQASFVAPAAAGPTESILAVVRNQGYLIPYVAGVLLCLGLVLHVGLRWRRLVVLALLPWLGLALPGHAQTTLPLEAWGTLPIQHEGRLKPLTTFAEVTLQQLHGRTHLEGLNATAWLAEAVLAPTRAHTRAIFILPSKALLNRLQLPERNPRAYTYPEISAALQPQFAALQSLAATPPSERDALDTQLLTLAEQVQLYYLLTQSLQQPHGPFTVMPPRLGEDTWLTPLAAPASPYRATWAAMAQAYQQGDTALWQAATQAAVRQAAQLPGVRPWALQVEVWLRALHPFWVASALFALAVLALLWAPAARWAPLALAAGLLVAGTAVAARVYILQRPPVGTLYESVLFVGLVVGLVALAAAGRDPARRRAWLWLGSVLGLVLQALGLRYAASGGDTLGVLTAVLDTNFWLTTHVLVITAGYALALLAGAWAHGVLLAAWRQGGRFTLEKAAQAPLMLLTLAALAATATGTLLGGIWADQSWGRFWGWDPKENGALLLTLWLAWVLHARLGGVFGPLGLVVGVAATPMVVAVAWFGVNLLGVGLHSYGFTEGTLAWLLLFLAGEALLLGSVAWRVGRRR
ncbi:MAG: cytochrome c biogenesis protein ResB [Alphaproteobacteria bacterium]|nr:cytochrome c biogenesis protein ResB [Alphaproteobacteria bacterium]